MRRFPPGASGRVCAARERPGAARAAPREHRAHASMDDFAGLFAAVGLASRGLGEAGAARRRAGRREAASRPTPSAAAPTEAASAPEEAAAEEAEPGGLAQYGKHVRNTFLAGVNGVITWPADPVMLAIRPTDEMRSDAGRCRHGPRGRILRRHAAGCAASRHRHARRRALPRSASFRCSASSPATR